MIATMRTLAAVRERWLTRRDELRRQASEKLRHLVDHLAREVRAGRIPNAERRGSPSIRRVAHHASIARAQTPADIARHFAVDADIDADVIAGEPVILTADEGQTAVARYKDRGAFAA